MCTFYAHIRYGKFVAHYPHIGYVMKETRTSRQASGPLVPSVKSQSSQICLVYSIIISLPQEIIIPTCTLSVVAKNVLRMWTYLLPWFDAIALRWVILGRQPIIVKTALLVVCSRLGGAFCQEASDGFLPCLVYGVGPTLMFFGLQLAHQWWWILQLNFSLGLSILRVAIQIWGQDKMNHLKTTARAYKRGRGHAPHVHGKNKKRSYK